MKTPVIEISKMGFRYGQNVVFDNNLTFSINLGDYVGIIGPNGGGKTTLLKLILGFLSPTSGEIKIFGTPIGRFTDQALIGYVPQNAANLSIDFPATVHEIIKSVKGELRFAKKQLKNYDETFEKAMEIAGVLEFKNRLISDLSGGERQRVFIARALASDPKILILDEPTIGIDIASQEKFFSFLSDLSKTLGITIIFVSHDFGVVAREVDYVLCLNRDIVCHAHPEELMKDEVLQKLYGNKLNYVRHLHN